MSGQTAIGVAVPTSPLDEGADTATARERADRIRLSLPLLLLAGASLVVSFVLYSDAFGGHATRVPLWVLAFSVGVIASAGGTASLLVGDFSGEEWRAEAEASQQFIVIDRSRWDSIQNELRSARGRGPAAGAVRAWGEGLDLPEWSEPAPPPARAPETPRAPLGPPAPMGVVHHIDSLATELDQLVADLEASAVEVGRGIPPRAPPVTPSPAANAEVPARGKPTARSASIDRKLGDSAPLRPRPSPVKSPTGGGKDADAGTVPPAPSESLEASRESPAAPATRATPKRPARPPSPIPKTADPVSPPAGEGLGAVEYRALLEELERQAGEAVARSSPPPGPESRCVGCDSKLGPSSHAAPCRSCRAPICGNCLARSTKDGHPDLCAVCAILEESGHGNGKP